MLCRLAERLESASAIVTYNGKSFDWPLLRTRFVMNRLRVPAPVHVDVLHLVRRVYRGRLSCLRLKALEAEVLGLEREEDLDGADIPPRYWKFLRTGEGALLELILSHNCQDILALMPKSIPKLYVINKIDLLGQAPRVEINGGDIHIYLSAKTGAGIELLREQILQLMDWRADAGVFMARERHVQALQQAGLCLERAAEVGARAELFAEELRLAQAALGKIVGEFSSDDLLGEIFSRFCIGK